MYFSLHPHSISIHSHFHRSSLTLSTLCHSSLHSFLHFLFFPILFINLLFPLLIFTLIAFHHDHTSHHHSHSYLSHHIHLFILSTFHAFSHHLICITLITSHIHLSFIPHHPHSILLPFHHSRIFYFSTHPFHHGALRDFLKTHFHPFHVSYSPIHYSILLFILFQLHHPHHHSSLLFIPIRIFILYPFIFIYSHPSLPLSHFYHTHSYPFPFHSSHSIPSHRSPSYVISLLTLHSHAFCGTLLFIIHRPHSSHPNLSSFLLSILCIQFISFLRFSSSFLYFEINAMFVFILLIALSFVVLIGNTLSQLDVIVYALYV